MARIRLRSVRFKDGGGSIRVLRQPEPSTEIADEFCGSARKCAESSVGGSQMVGFAIVAWAASGEVFVNYRNGEGSGVAGGGVGQYAKDILLAEQAIRWARD